MFPKKLNLRNFPPIILNRSILHMNIIRNNRKIRRISFGSDNRSFSANNFHGSCISRVNLVHFLQKIKLKFWTLINPGYGPDHFFALLILMLTIKKSWRFVQKAEANSSQNQKGKAHKKNMKISKLSLPPIFNEQSEKSQKNFPHSPSDIQSHI